MSTRSRLVCLDSHRFQYEKFANAPCVGFGATGKFWGHEHWNLTSPPDIVTFSKKANTAGYFFGNPKLVPDKAYRQFNTYVALL